MIVTAVGSDTSFNISQFLKVAFSTDAIGPRISILVRCLQFSKELAPTLVTSFGIVIRSNAVQPVNT